MTTTLTREARYARIAEQWPELRQDCPGYSIQGRCCYLGYERGTDIPCRQCGGKGWTAKADAWALLVAAKQHGAISAVVIALMVVSEVTATSGEMEDALLAAVERRLGLEE